MELLNYPIQENHIYNNIISNYKFYAPIIEGIYEEKYQVLSNIGENLVDKSKFVGSTPSICVHNDELVVNRRFVDYKIDFDGNYNSGDYITTINIISRFSMDAEQLVRKSDDYKLYYDTMNDCRYVGLEDVRLFSLGGKLLYNANRGIEKGMVVEHGEITLVSEENPMTKDEVFIKKTGQLEFEKNWVLFIDIHNKKKCVYSWFPLVIGSLSGDKFLKTHEIKLPNSLRNVRGSTNGVIIGDEIWFIGHIVSYEDRRYYYHSMIVLDRLTFELKRYTPFFTFRGEKVEYTLGFIFKDDKFIIGYSTMDKTTQFVTVEKDWFSKMFGRLDFEEKIEDKNEVITINM
jgi:hypothetical protein